MTGSGKMLTQAERREKIGGVLRVSSGNFLEQYDFFVFGFYADYIGQTFFPSDDKFASLMLAFATFAVGFFMRPVGALILGAYVDRKGRRAGLLLTLGLMATGTLSIALVPGYATIGVLAPILVVIGRLLQGFSAGVELGAVSIYLAEIATPGRKGFYCAWQSASQQVAVVFAALLGLLLSTVLPAQALAAWGWRIPLVIGCLIIPLLFLLRRSLKETAAFEAQTHRPSLTEALGLAGRNWRVIVRGVMLSALTTTLFYLSTAYTPTYGKQVLHLDARDALLVTVCVGLSNFCWLPIGGALSDRIGRRPLLFALSGLTIVTAFPALEWLVSAPSFTRLLAVELWLSFIFGMYNGAMIPFLSEIMPSRVRTVAFSLAFSLATAIFGGSSLAISTWLIRQTGNPAMPAAWLSLAALLALCATFTSRRPGDRGQLDDAIASGRLGFVEPPIGLDQ